MPKKSRALVSMFFTVFLDMMGIGIVVPILATILLQANSGLLPVSASLSTRTIVLGFLVAAYPLAQFFGAPILGALSDRLGRKKILVFPMTASLLGYIVFGIGIVTHNLPLLFLSRIIDGFMGGNISIVLSSIADISADEETKTRNFGLIGMAFGLGLILGPYLGGQLANPHLVSWFNNATPFWVAAGLTSLNLILVITWFTETLKERIHTPVSIFTGVKNVYKAFHLPNLRAMFFVTFFLEFGFNFFTQFFQVFLIAKFAFNQGNIGNFFAYAGVLIAVTQGVFTRPLSKRFKADAILKYSIIGLALSLPLLLLPKHITGLVLILPLVAIFQGLTQPNLTAIISQLSKSNSQGEVMGIKQSLQSLGQAIPPIIAGFIVSFHLDLPIIVAAIANFVAWIIFVVFYRANRKEKFVEV